jgi:hypothetical protein
MTQGVVTAGCAVSAGVHAALTPAHFREGVGTGTGFLAASIVLAALAAILTGRPDRPGAVLATALVLSGLIGSYTLAVTTGVPVLHPDPEHVDGLALGTKGIEAAALLAAAASLRPKGRER